MNGDAVWLDLGPRWGAIPRAVQLRIEQGVERIRATRGAIAGDAKVRYMPPVTIDPAVWSPDGRGIVHAAAGAWPSGSEGREIGVLAGAGPAISRDDSLVRALLVHEFAHCFSIATRVINHLDLGAALDLTGDSMDEDRDRATLVKPADWFGESDGTLLAWSDPRLAPLAHELIALVHAGHLPGTGLPQRGTGPFIVPPEWGAHIRQLRRRTTG